MLSFLGAQAKKIKNKTDRQASKRIRDIKSFIPRNDGLGSGMGQSVNSVEADELADDGCLFGFDGFESRVPRLQSDVI